MGSGGIGSLLDTSRRALFAQQSAISTIGNNIANVNTPGYSRRRVEFSSLAGTGTGISLGIGTGVDATSVIRIVDRLFNNELSTRVSERASADIQQEFLRRAETPFVLDQETSISVEFQDFVASLEDLKVDPSNIALRNQVITAGQALSQSIRLTMDTISDLQREADSRIAATLGEVNRLTAQIGDLNLQITSTETTEQENLALRDQRDQLLKNLSEFVSFETVEDERGQTTVYLADGFALVSGTVVRPLEFTSAPDFAPTGGYPSGMDGSPLGHIVFDANSTAGATAHIDLTSVVGAGQGELAGLLNLRGIQSSTDTSPFDADGDLVALGARVESVARTLLTNFNTEYLGLVSGSPTSFDLDGNATSDPYSLFTFQFNGTRDADSDGLPDDLAALGISSYARLLQFGTTDPRRIAAGRDVDSGTAGVQTAPGDSANLDGLTNLLNTQFTYSLGNFSSTSSLPELYNDTVSLAGSLSANAQSDFQILSDREQQVEELVSSTSDVSLDEEFAKLITFQRAFDANARMIRVGDELLAEIIGILG